jgi:hypothetical protein
LRPHLDIYAKILRALTRDAGDSCARLTMPRLREAPSLNPYFSASQFRLLGA